MLILLGQTALGWLVLTLLGLAALPLAFWLLGRLPGRGVVFARPLGLLLVSYILWMGGSLRLLPNNLAGLSVAILGLAGLSAWLAFRGGGNWSAIRTHLRQNWRWLLVAEVLFALALLGWAYLRATASARAMPTGGEKFMEMAFLNSVLNSPSFPAFDPWLSGFSISYYYFGYVMMAVFTRLVQLPSSAAFDLYDAVLFAFSLQLSFGLVSEMSALSGARRAGRLAAGAIAAFFTAGMGNLEGLLEALYSRGWLPQGFTSWLNLPDFPPNSPASGSFYPGSTDWWWWRASRVLSDLGFDGKPLPLHPITEFPFFSFLLGDNHPHVLALPFGLLALAVGLDGSLAGGRLPLPRLALSALVIGSLIFLNTWDFPVLFVLALLAYLAGEYSRSGKLFPSAWREAGLRALGLGIGGVLLYLPFLLSFRSQAGGVLPYIFPPTRLPQYLVMFGLFILVLLFFLPASIHQQNPAAAQPFDLKRLAAWWLRTLLVFGAFFLAILALTVLVLLIDQQRGGSIIQLVQSWVGGGGIQQALQRAITTRLADPWLFLLLTLLLCLAAAGLYASPRQIDPSSPDSGLRGSPRQFAALGPDPGPNTSSPQNSSSGPDTGPNTSSPHNSLSEPDPGPNDLSPQNSSSGPDAGSNIPSPQNASSAPDNGLAFARLLAFCGLGLTFAVEFLYLRDSFGVRMNTVFKFYFQGWTLMSCASGYAVWWMARRRRLRLLFFGLLALLSAACLVYPLMAAYARTAGYDQAPLLDATAILRRADPDDWAAIDWLRSQPLNGIPPTILEAPCPSYCFGGRISAFSGFPALLGWSNHEGQWRGSFTEQARREADIRAIFTTATPQETRDLLQKWQVRYVIFGETERIYIRNQCTKISTLCTTESVQNRLGQSLSVAFRQGNLIIYQVDQR